MTLELFTRQFILGTFLFVGFLLGTSMSMKVQPQQEIAQEESIEVKKVESPEVIAKN